MGRLLVFEHGNGEVREVCLRSGLWIRLIG